MDINYENLGASGDWVHENAIDYNLVTTSTPFDEALVRYLGKRGRMR